MNMANQSCQMLSLPGHFGLDPVRQGVFTRCTLPHVTLEHLRAVLMMQAQNHEVAEVVRRIMLSVPPQR